LFSALILEPVYPRPVFFSGFLITDPRLVKMRLLLLLLTFPVVTFEPPGALCVTVRLKEDPFPPIEVPPRAALPELIEPLELTDACFPTLELTSTDLWTLTYLREDLEAREVTFRGLVAARLDVVPLNRRLCILLVGRLDILLPDWRLLDPPPILGALRLTDLELIDAGRDLLTRVEPEDLTGLPPLPRDDRIADGADDRIADGADDLAAAWLLPPPLDLPPPPRAFFAIRGSANSNKAKVTVRRIIVTCFVHFSVNMAYLLSFPSQTLTKQPYLGPPSVEGTKLRSGNTVFTSKSLSFQSRPNRDRASLRQESRTGMKTRMKTASRRDPESCPSTAVMVCRTGLSYYQSVPCA
jgi:hypothetical protein